MSFVLLKFLLGSLAVLSLGLTLWQWLVARRFPLHQRLPSPAFAPPVTLLKPLKGCDPATESCLRSWVTQDYAGPVQILFGVASADDPVCPLVRALIQEFPGRDAELVVCGPLLGANLKVSKLAQLGPLAKHDLLLISDADVHVPPDFLANVVAPLEETSVQESSAPSGLYEPKDAKRLECPRSAPLSIAVAERASAHNGEAEPAAAQSPRTPNALCDIQARVEQRQVLPLFPGPGAVGLVTCFYRLANPTTLAMQWEAVAINADFWSQVLQARSLKPLDFALGAVMVVRRQQLDEMGGFDALADCLADDYQLGHRLAQRGYRIVLSPVVAECWDEPMGWAAVWKHQLRWARTIRVCQPLPYFFSILSNATLWPLLWLAAFPGRLELAFALGCGAVRIATARNLTSLINIPLMEVASDACQVSRVRTPRHSPPVTRHFTPLSSAWLPLLKDLLQAAIWLLAFLGNRIEWRGQKMKLRPDGTLVRPTPKPNSPSG